MGQEHESALFMRLGAPAASFLVSGGYLSLVFIFGAICFPSFESPGTFIVLVSPSKRAFFWVKAASALSTVFCCWSD